MNTLDAISSRRSIRAFTPDEVSEKEMHALIQSAAAAPSGGNAQAWIFISIRDARRIQALRAISPGMSGKPPAVIALCLDENRVSSPHCAPDFQSCYDLGAAMQNILLTAHELGLGGCAIASFHQQSLANLLHLPGHIKPHLLVAIGKPRLFPAAPYKRGLSEIHCHETWG